MVEVKTEPPPDPSDGAGTVELDTPINEKALLRKIDAKLLPAVGVLYLLSFLDRSNGEFLVGISSSRYTVNRG